MKKTIRVLSMIGLIFAVIELAVLVCVVLAGLGLIVVPAIMGANDGSLQAVFEYVKQGTHGEIDEVIQHGIILILFIVLGMLIIDVFAVFAVYFGAIVAMKAVFTQKAKFIENSRDSKMVAPLGVLAGLLDCDPLVLVAGFMAFAYKSEAEKEALAIARGDKLPEEKPVEVKEEPTKVEEKPVEEKPAEEKPAEEKKAEKKAPAKKPAAKKAPAKK